MGIISGLALFGGLLVAGVAVAALLEVADRVIKRIAKRRAVPRV